MPKHIGERMEMWKQRADQHLGNNKIILPKIGLMDSHYAQINGHFIEYTDTAAFDKMTGEYVPGKKANAAIDEFQTIKIKHHALVIIHLLKKGEKLVPEKAEGYRSAIQTILQLTGLQDDCVEKDTNGNIINSRTKEILDVWKQPTRENII